MSGYTVRNKVLRAADVVLGASETNTQVSNVFTITAADSLNFLAQVRLSAATHVTGITAKLQHCADGENWQDVGSSAQASATAKAADCGVAEVSTTTWPTFAGAAQADYLHITAQDGSTFSVWLDKDAAGTAPTGALYTATPVANRIEVDIVTGDTAAQVTTKVRAAMVANAPLVAAFTVGAAGAPTNDDIVLTQLSTGAVADPVPKTENDGGAGSIAVVVGTAGSNGDISIANNTVTETTHGWITGDRVYVYGSDLPAGLTTATTYYIIKVDANTYKLATTLANAVAGTAVDLTDFGSSTLTAVGSDLTIRMLVTDSTDVAQMPLWPMCRFVMSTGASDAATVSAVYVAART
jgi:hypothetical protein